jgi:hypothetical protein
MKTAFGRSEAAGNTREGNAAEQDRCMTTIKARRRKGGENDETNAQTRKKGSGGAGRAGYKPQAFLISVFVGLSMNLSPVLDAAVACFRGSETSLEVFQPGGRTRNPDVPDRNITPLEHGAPVFIQAILLA